MSGNNNGIGAYMPVQPAYGGGYGNGGLFGNGGDIWALLFVLALLGGNWGGFGGFGWGGMGLGMMGAGMGMDMLYPWLNNSQNINGGSRDQMISGKLDAISAGQSNGFSQVQLGLAGIGRDICQTGNGITAAVTGGFAAAESAENARQMALLQQLFGIQTAQQQCCCDQRAATEGLRYTIATEAANTRAASSADTQRVLDKLCQLELDNERAQRAADQREIARLNSELMYARGQASQIEQTAQIRAAQATTANQLVNELRSCPIPSQPVYGNQPIFQCQPNYGGCGCSGNNFGFGYAAA